MLISYTTCISLHYLQKEKLSTPTKKHKTVLNTKVSYIVMWNIVDNAHWEKISLTWQIFLFISDQIVLDWG